MNITLKNIQQDEGSKIKRLCNFYTLPNIPFRLSSLNSYVKEDKMILSILPYQKDVIPISRMVLFMFI